MPEHGMTANPEHTPTSVTSLEINIPIDKFGASEVVRGMISSQRNYFKVSLNALN